jgi:Pentapeptide repeats (8 copies)
VRATRSRDSSRGHQLGFTRSAGSSIGLSWPRGRSPWRRRVTVVLMKPRQKHRIAWMICALLAGLVLVGCGVLGVRLRPYWMAKYRGRDAELHTAVLSYAPLSEADLCGADLRAALLDDATLAHEYGYVNDDARAVLGIAIVHYDEHTRWPEGFDPKDPMRLDLRNCVLEGFDLRHAKLRGADLHGAYPSGADLSDGDLTDADLSGAQYDADTRWPAGFNPARHGAVKVERARSHSDGGAA